MKKLFEGFLLGDIFWIHQEQSLYNQSNNDQQFMDDMRTVVQYQQ